MKPEPKKKKKIALVSEPSLVGPLNLIIEFKTLKEHGVDKVYYLSGQRQEIELDTVLFLVPPRFELMKSVAEQISGDLSFNIRKNYFLYFVPQRSLLCERILEQEGVFGFLKLGFFPLDFIPLDTDVISLQNSSSFKETVVEHDFTSLFHLARALDRLQNFFGKFKAIKGKGVASQYVRQVMKNLESWKDQDAFDNTPTSLVNQVILFDRSIDLLTPLCTQLSYEGLLDEFFQIKNTFIEIEPTYLKLASSVNKAKFPLNSNDKIFQEIRDRNFSSVPLFLSQKAKTISENYKEFREFDKIEELKKFMSKFPTMTNDHNLLYTHTCLAEDLGKNVNGTTFRRLFQLEQEALSGREMTREIFDELINIKPTLNLSKILRLLCIFSYTHNGIRQPLFDHIRWTIINLFGFKHITTFLSLERLSLLKPFPEPSSTLTRGPSFAKDNSFPSLAKGLELIVEEVDEANPNDISYLFSGYAPISCRVLDYLYFKSRKPSSGGLVPFYNRNVEDLIKQHFGPSVEEIYPNPKLLATPAAPVILSASSPTMSTTPSGPSRSPSPGPVQTPPAIPRTITMVVFIGGVTHAEISALRFISKQLDNHQILIATTNIISGNTMLEPLISSQDDLL
eukprot:TRINITY_DN2773_c0_g1_i1.p1 TRINITY_DN2773_c0_g1~~TRINITY_DN2773_c0_g1_i1.p1  ORF type:complete len:623 (-),score=99.24 TRINITY_DN2773_c0_g1_i1:17-1885(-)